VILIIPSLRLILGTTAAEASGSRNLTSMDKLVALLSHPAANLFSRGMSVAKWR